MAVTTQCDVVISCDGVRQECPLKSEFSTNFSLTASIRLAGRAGWQVSDLILCPECQASAKPRIQEPSPLDAWRERRMHRPSTLVRIAS